jgi:hypothetical protein
LYLPADLGRFELQWVTTKLQSRTGRGIPKVEEITIDIFGWTCLIVLQLDLQG